jgi:hypothetical protein
VDLGCPDNITLIIVRLPALTEKCRSVVICQNEPFFVQKPTVRQTTFGSNFQKDKDGFDIPDTLFKLPRKNSSSVPLKKRTYHELEC